MTSRQGQFDSQSARAAALERWARTPDPSVGTHRARAAFLARFERQADPEGLLTPTARQQAAQRLLRAYMIRMARARELARRVKHDG